MRANAGRAPGTPLPPAISKGQTTHAALLAQVVGVRRILALRDAIIDALLLLV